MKEDEMDIKAGLVIVVWTLSQFQNAYCHRCDDLNMPFTSRFENNYICWGYNNKFWAYTGENKVPNTTNIPSFQTDGNFIWAQRNATHKDYNYLESHKIPNVTKETKISIRYWLHSSQPNDLMSIIFYKMSGNLTEMMTFHKSTSGWQVATIDCQQQVCCEGDDTCDIKLAIAYEFGCKMGECLAAVQCVSSELNGCRDPLPTTTTEVTPTTKKIHFASLLESAQETMNTPKYHLCSSANALTASTGLLATIAYFACHFRYNGMPA